MNSFIRANQYQSIGLLNTGRVDINALAMLILLNTSDPPRLRTGEMLMLKCFSTIAYNLPR
jgi:hypothetical protein